MLVLGSGASGCNRSLGLPSKVVLLENGYSEIEGRCPCVSSH